MLPLLPFSLSFRKPFFDFFNFFLPKSFRVRFLVLVKIVCILIIFIDIFDSRIEVYKAVVIAVLSVFGIEI